MSHPGYRQRRWWKEASVYQVYPASFCDSNGDGWGDVPGMTSKINHLQELGVDVLWTSPIFKSPQVDMGYDISDYKDIDPKYGTLEDVDHLIAELKKRDMRLMMDLVVNHTSDKHAWFEASRSSRSNSKRDWYIWKPARVDEDGNHQPPNNWSMILGEENSAWTYDEKTKEYYLALFTPEQPDLNWENPAVREAVIDVMDFWLRKGVCGFRMDVINHISKDQSFPDAPVTQPGQKYQPGHQFYANGPRLHEYLKELNSRVLGRYDSMTVGEMPFISSPKEILKVVGAQEKELNMIFIFDLVCIDDKDFRMTLKDWKPKEIKEIMAHWQRVMIDMDGWNSVFCENHDNPRAVSRYCDDSPEYREVGAKLLSLMSTTLSGTPYIYEGQEIGMRNIPGSANWPIEEYKDVETQNFWKKTLNAYPNDPKKQQEARHIIDKKARDHARTPMQWSDGPNAGFCASDVRPWMRVMPDYQQVNVEAQRSGTADTQLPKEGARNSRSVLSFWQRGLKDRKDHAATFVYGDFELLEDPSHLDLFAYIRRPEAGQEDATFVVALNFTAKTVQWQVPQATRVKSWVCGTWHADKADSKPLSGKIELRPWEGILGVCEATHVNGY